MRKYSTKCSGHRFQFESVYSLLSERSTIELAIVPIDGALVKVHLVSVLNKWL